MVWDVKDIVGLTSIHYKEETKGFAFTTDLRYRQGPLLSTWINFNSGID